MDETVIKEQASVVLIERRKCGCTVFAIGQGHVIFPCAPHEPVMLALN